MKSKGADISETGTDDFVIDLKELIDVCAVTWSGADSTEAGKPTSNLKAYQWYFDTHVFAHSMNTLFRLSPLQTPAPMTISVLCFRS